LATNVANSPVRRQRKLHRVTIHHLRVTLLPDWLIERMVTVLDALSSGPTPGLHPRRRAYSPKAVGGLRMSANTSITHPRTSPPWHNHAQGGRHMAIIHLDLPADEADAFARLLKRMTLDDCIRHSNKIRRYPDGRTEHDTMWSAVLLMQQQFAEAGFAPR